MLKHLNNRRKKGQSTLEYAILIVVILAALLTIQTYMKRSVQGKIRSASDDIGDQFKVGSQNETKRTMSHSESTDTFKSGVSKTQLKNEVSNTMINSQIVKPEEDYWGSTPTAPTPVP